MGAFTQAVRNLASVTSFAPIAIQPWQNGRQQLSNGRYEVYAREGYSLNELVFACVEELSTSAAEPKLMVRQGKDWKHDHAVLDLLNSPNPFMDRFEFFATVLLHRSIAGNAFALIVRSLSGRAVQLWMMRPDRVSIIPDATTYIARYEYDAGLTEKIKLPPGDVIHFKTRNPLNDFYGMPPLMVASGRVDVDNYSRDFVKAYFQNAGVPAGMLSIKGKMDANAKTEIKQRFRNDFGGPQGWHDLLVLDNTEAAFTPMTANLGASGLVLPELDKMDVRRIAMCFGVPPALVGADDAPTSYAALEMVQRFFWDNTLAPLYKEIAGPLNLRLKPNFLGVDEIAFDLSDVRALQEDVDQIHARWRSDLISGGCTIEEFRIATGRSAQADGGTYLLPANLVPVGADEIKAGDVRESVKGMPQGEESQAGVKAPVGAPVVATPPTGGDEPQPAPAAPVAP
jgi:HK97 family phage portal protein